MVDLVVVERHRDSLWRAALKSRSFVIGLVLTVIFTAGALVSFFWTPYDVTVFDIANRLKCPPVQDWFWDCNPGPNWFGTDHFGRDIFSMLMVGARTSIAVAFVAVGIGVVLGVPLGLAAAARKGRLLDELIMRSNDLVFAFPALLIAIMITAVFGPSAVNAIIAIGIFNVPVFARLARGAALTLWTREFVLAARVAGKGGVRISLEHIAPNILNLLIVQGTIQFSLGIRGGAFLRGARGPAAGAKLGADAGRRPDHDFLCPPHGGHSGAGHRVYRSWDQSDGGRVARYFRPQSAAEPDMNLLQVKNLSLEIGDTPILHDVDLELDGGEILGVIGESGSGKSMSALAIMQLAPGDSKISGSIQLAGNELVGKSEEYLCAIRGKDVAMIFQEPMSALNPVKTIGDQVAETVLVHTKVSRPEARRIARETLDRVELPADQFPMGRFAHELSGGQRQRVVIAMAIALRPKLLIADEPTTALDVTTQAEILKLLGRLVREDGMGLILITHDLAVVAGMADTISIMRAGRVVEAGKTLPVFRHMKHPYTKALFAASGHVPKRAPNRAVHRDVLVLKVDDVVRDYPGRRRSLFKKPKSLRAVDRVSFSIYRGENVALVGESGCGKSTLTRALLALDKMQSGSVYLDDGEHISAKEGASRTARAKMQVVFQDPYGSFNPRHKVARLVAEPFHLLDNPPRGEERRQRIERALVEVGMEPEDAAKYIHEFSGGQRQRIAIARALIIEPSLIILDEAVSALDVSIRAQILDLLAGLSDRLGLSYLFISHDLSVVRTITDRVLVMKEGKIVEEGRSEEVFANPRHPYTRELIAAVPDIERALAAREKSGE